MSLERSLIKEGKKIGFPMQVEHSKSLPVLPLKSMNHKKI